MADAPVVHIGENSPEEVAYKLFQMVANVEGKKLYRDQGAADRAYILRTYYECLRSVKGYEPE